MYYTELIVKNIKDVIFFQKVLYSVITSNFFIITQTIIHISQWNRKKERNNCTALTETNTIKQMGKTAYKKFKYVKILEKPKNKTL